MNPEQLARMAAGRKRAQELLREEAWLVVQYYREFLHDEAEHWAKHGTGLSWATIEVPTDAQFAMARS